MGGEFGQWNEWNSAVSLDWHLTEQHFHKGVQNWMKDLNHLYKDEPAMHEQDCVGAGFEWNDCSDYEQSIISFFRFAKDREDMVLVVCNFTPVVRHNYMVGVPKGGFWKEVLNSDSVTYGGSGVGNYGGLDAWEHTVHGKPYALPLTLPPLAVLVLKPA
jgi:1,4-alpha-glucan branching enzyme